MRKAKPYGKPTSAFMALVCCWAGALILAGLQPALAYDKSPDAVRIGAYQAAEKANDLPSELASMGRLDYGNVDQLLFGSRSQVVKYSPEGGTQHFTWIAGVSGDFNWLSSIFGNGPTVEVAVDSGGQGCRHEELWVDENGNLTNQHQYSYEWSHADHDATDQGVGYLCPRTGRKFLGYGNPYYIADYPPSDEGMHMKGLVLEYNGPTAGVWDSWTNQLAIPGHTAEDLVGIQPKSFVVLDDGRVLLSGYGSDGGTYFPILESRPWDGALVPNADRRAPQKQGYWELAKHGGDGDPIVVGGIHYLWDPYVEGGDFNDIIFLMGDLKPWYSYRDNPTGFWQCKVFASDGAGGYTEVDSLPGQVYGWAVHPLSKKPIIAVLEGDITFYEAVLDPADWKTVNLYPVAFMDTSGLAGPILGHTYRDGAYFATGGSRGGGMLYKLEAVVKAQ